MIPVEVVCPYCSKSLMNGEHPIKEAPSIALWGRLPSSEGGAEGLIRLSAFYGDYQIETTLVIPADVVVEFICPFCRHLLASTRGCEACRAPMVALQFPRGGRVQFCSRRGCRKHLIEFDDTEEQLRAFYREYSPFIEG
ncbi:MAG: hypothetical protein FJY67_08940 [Calditrichaeota bacterium]|nr:hypothetical protein [Calditrichota bacterium]